MNDVERTILDFWFHLVHYFEHKSFKIFAVLGVALLDGTPVLVVFSNPIKLTCFSFKIFI